MTRWQSAHRALPAGAAIRTVAPAPNIGVTQLVGSTLGMEQCNLLGLVYFQAMNDVLKKLFARYAGHEPTAIEPLKAHASNRQIFRVRSASHCAIGVINADARENKIFIEFTKHFRAFGLPVPEIYAEDSNANAYIEQDLGDTTLFDALSKARGESDEVPVEIEELYRKALAQLTRFQIEASPTLDFNLCYPHKAYERTSMLWDMHYFRDNFLRRTRARWQTSTLERDFQVLVDFLVQAKGDYFMYRDFQSRNIMVLEGEVYFIDYQAGRRGPLQYDVVSLLFQSKAALPAEVRDRLLYSYLDAAEKYLPNLDRATFLTFLHGFVLIRLMQVLGTYGEKGLGDKKEYFIASIPHAIKNLNSVLQTAPLPFRLPALLEVSSQLIDLFDVRRKTNFNEPLKVNIFSFSYRRGVPSESSEHGGGFVFDCRCLPNPGREIAYRDLTGRDESVIGYLENRSEVQQFMQGVYALVDQAVLNYLSRGFVSLTVCFGCTGGQHRSVYAAERLATHLGVKFQVHVEVHHLELARMKIGQGA